MPAFFGARRALVSGVAAAPALWTPAAIGTTSIVAWFDPTSGVTQSSGKVSAWADRIKGLSATQATAANQPTYSATGFNGKPGLVFGGSQMLAVPIGTMPGNAADVSFAGTGLISNQAYIFSYGPGASSIWHCVNADGSNYLQDAHYGGEASATALALMTSARVFTVEYSASGQTDTYSVDGTSQVVGISTSNSSANAYAWIGAAPTSDAAGKLSGSLGDLLIFNRVLTASERAKLQGYLAWKSGLQANLPDPHPFKARAPYVSDP